MPIDAAILIPCPTLRDRPRHRVRQTLQLSTTGRSPSGTNGSLLIETSFFALPSVLDTDILQIRNDTRSTTLYTSAVFWELLLNDEPSC
jgi:hypothetical protein